MREVISLRVDIRAGSQELIAPLRRWGVAVEEATLTAGDVEIVGNGPASRPMMVGIEVKKIPDLLQCVRNGRFADQLRAMKQTYEVSWLLVEGRWHGFAQKDDLQVRKGERWYQQPGHLRYQEVASWVLTMCAAAGMLVWRTECEEETVAWLRAHEVWWTAKEYEAHRAHFNFYTPPLSSGDPFAEPSLVRKVANVLPGLSDTLSSRVEGQFATVRQMVNAAVEDWVAVDGIGKKKAKTLVEVLGG